MIKQIYINIIFYIYTGKEMSKKYTCAPTLLIVESPAKCKKIEEYLGPGYKCVASFGHMRELTSLEDINKETFDATYQIMSSKKNQVKNIQQAIKNAGEVIIATDNDREGEAIGWHLCKIFGLDIINTKRIIFHEITENAIKYAVANPVKLDLNIVYAQQTRQILDLIVGYEISPLLWKYINTTSKKPLSAGRCQTPTLKIIRDNQLEVDTNPGRKVYKTTGYFSINNWIIPFVLNKDMEQEEEVIDFLEKTISFSHLLNCSGPVKKFSSPPKPFTTSTIQQTCSNELHISPKETMKICQTLYEKGFITYMRTDSICYSMEFIQKAHKYIQTTWADNYINKECKPQSENNAHEAIRPTNISLSHIENNPEFTLKEKNVYKIIWQNTLESLMVSCSYTSITAKITASYNTFFTNISDLVLFPGWKIVKNKLDMENKEYNYFSNILSLPNITVTYSKINSEVNMLQGKLHLTEAKIIQVLEQKGIGRPSTYASLVEKIQERDYVKKKDLKGKKIECKNMELEKDKINYVIEKKEFGNEKGKLVIQALGNSVHDFLESHFADIFSYDFTKNLENDLDLIALGRMEKREVCEKYYNKLVFLKNKVINIPFKEEKEEIFLDNQHSIIHGKYGPVIKYKDENNNVSFKGIRKDLDLDLSKKSLNNNNITLKDLIEKKNLVVPNPWMYQNTQLSIKKGKFGLYAKWGNNTKSLRLLGNRPIENIRLEEVLDILDR